MQSFVDNRGLCDAVKLNWWPICPGKSLKGANRLASPWKLRQGERARTLWMSSWHMVCEMTSLNLRSNMQRTPPNLQFRKKKTPTCLMNKTAIFIGKLCPACLGLNLCKSLKARACESHKWGKIRNIPLFLVAELIFINVVPIAGCHDAGLLWEKAQSKEGNRIQSTPGK